MDRIKGKFDWALSEDKARMTVMKPNRKMMMWNQIYLKAEAAPL